MSEKLLPSQRSTIQKENADRTYNASCIHCGGDSEIRLWPHRNGGGYMVGFVFLCAKCEHLAHGIWLEIHGIRGQEEQNTRAPDPLAERNATQAASIITMDAEITALKALAARLAEALQDAAEELASALARLGVCGEGDHKDHKADAESYGGTEALRQARLALAEWDKRKPTQPSLHSSKSKGS